MKIQDTTIHDVKLLVPTVHGDHRGHFFESYNEDTFTKLGLPTTWAQDNHSLSRKSCLRGLHYQVPPKAQKKLVRVTQGKVFDVVVDLRKSSPTFGQHTSAILSDVNHHMMLIPEGFAHGFYVLSESATFLYKCSNVYSRKHEHTIRYDDPDLQIQWPFLDGFSLQLSQRDLEGTSFSEAPYFE